ncbi:hypothetical protein [Edaphocola flava]|uniref:hypothetical protein n=1 Tax=Edaphocola flava TaxID=2499629 RepID=UPI00100AD657|nr:hypothetical protein [Edaphocola flava]
MQQLVAMQKEQLQELIDKLEETQLVHDAYFKIGSENGHHTESYIRANKEGLRLFALRLLKASNQNEKTSLPHWFDITEEWLEDDSEVFINHIQILQEKRTSVPPEIESSDTGGKLLGYGCILIMLLLITSTIIGLITIVQWISG